MDKKDLQTQLDEFFEKEEELFEITNQNVEQFFDFVIRFIDECNDEEIITLSTTDIDNNRYYFSNEEGDYMFIYIEPSYDINDQAREDFFNTNDKAKAIKYIKEFKERWLKTIKPLDN